MKINNYILGVSDSHESGICLIKNKKVIFAINEERISRLKNDQNFPEKSIKLALKKFKINTKEISAVCVAGISRESDNIPTNNNLTDNSNLIPFEISLLGNLSNYFIFKKILKSNFFFYFLTIFFKIKLIKRKILIKQKLKNLNINSKNIFFFDHHLCHIFSAFSSSKFSNSLIVSNDGMGDGLCSRIVFIKKNKITLLSKNSFYNSLAMIYGYCSDLCGFKKNHHNGKTTGISAIGNGYEVFAILKKIINWNEKRGIYENNEGVFTSSYKKIKKLLKKFNKFEIANGIQNLTDEIIVKQTKHFLKKLNTNNLCYAGGLHANVLTNFKLRENFKNKNIFIFPNMGDGGLSLGSCALGLYKLTKQIPKFKLKNMYLGDGYHDHEILKFLNDNKIRYEVSKNLEKDIAIFLSEKKIIALFNSRMEYGPRALGNRSILFHALDKKINMYLNKKLNRTETMPFAPIFNLKNAKKLIKNFKQNDLISCENMTMCVEATDLMKKMAPAAVHVDNTIRPQVLSKKYNNFVYNILEQYNKLTSKYVLINTSFNLHEEPIIRTPNEAYQSFKKAKLDILILNKYILKR